MYDKKEIDEKYYFGELKMRDTPMKPQKEELGGGVIYRCHWLMCNNIVNKWDCFCSKCGQKLDFEDEL